MEFDNSRSYINKKLDSDSEIKLVNIIQKAKSNWILILTSVLLGVLIAFIYLRYSEPQFRVRTTIFIDDEDNGGLASTLSAFEDLGIPGSNSNKSIVNEIGVLKSYSLMRSVIEGLNLNISYFSQGKIGKYEIYGKDLPIKVNYFIKDSVSFNTDREYKIIHTSETEFLFQTEGDESMTKYSFGNNIKVDFGEINIVPANNHTISPGSIILLKTQKLDDVCNYYMDKVKIEPQQDLSSILVLSLTDPVKEKAKSILNYLVSNYVIEGVNFKIKISENTDNFINDRIMDISEDLNDVDRGVEEFKTKNKLTNIEYESSLVLESNSEVGKRIVELSSQIQVLDYISDYLNNNSDQLIPPNLGVNDDSSNNIIQDYNKLLLERNRILKGSSRMNPTVIALDEQLLKLRQSIRQSLASSKSSLNFSLDQAKNQEYKLNVRRGNAPQQEREFQDIKRKQVIIESLYLYLLEKREENAISLGIPVPNAKVVDKAYGSDKPVSPIPILIYVVSIFLGAVFSISIILFKSLLDNKVHSTEDVELMVEAPILGEIPMTSSKRKLVMNDAQNDGIAEAFRLVRTNINFMLNNSQNEPKVIFLTSTIGSEGKTFTAINLAMSMGLLEKRVLLIEADIRKPKIAKYLKLSRPKGLTHFLVDKDVEPQDIIFKNEETHIDIITSGEIPPNPSELLLNGRFEKIVKYSKENYDFIFIDTAPVSVVTDTLLLGSLADSFIYVIRAEFLDKKLLKIPQLMYKNKRLPNMAILLNSVVKQHGTYSYGYKNEKKSFWNSLFSK
ncbi:polysaccharide biosynthesis tyrosine autokinase [Lutimonas halocynthiae]|uniref:GumC family protein n=1 Tax=Lutimonas halocynthiae TaxID=1446477 RepID=UPI0025B5FFF4|nr:tyrosine-protein kinase family protein [Lutimonas halocynthiae]MDN3641066.1 polysaccharide biosynthesis tyrosine autokinase [Lutimonas halocynthiae]